MITWTLQGGGEWRFTMHAYPFYLLAAFAAVAWIVYGVRVAHRQPHVDAYGVARRSRRRESAGHGGLIAIAWLASFWSPYFVARESLLAGEPTSVAAGDNDGVFFGTGWTGLVHSGMVTSRFANAERATLRVPFPERRAYHLVLRMDAVPDANGSPQRVRLFIDNRPSGVFDLAWNEERVGAVTLDSAGERRLARARAARFRRRSRCAARPGRGIISRSAGIRPRRISAVVRASDAAVRHGCLSSTGSTGTSGTSGARNLHLSHLSLGDSGQQASRYSPVL